MATTSWGNEEQEKCEKGRTIRKVQLRAGFSFLGPFLPTTQATTMMIMMSSREAPTTAPIINGEFSASLLVAAREGGKRKVRRATKNEGGRRIGREGIQGEEEEEEEEEEEAYAQ